MSGDLAARNLRKKFAVKDLPGTVSRCRVGSPSSLWTRLFFVGFFLFLGTGVVALFHSPASTYEFIFDTLSRPIQHIAQGFVSEVRRDTLGRTNMLLLGIGGQNHDGGYLTDTNLVLSFNHQDKSVAMISVPRDLYSEIPGNGAARLNLIYDMGRTSYPDPNDKFLMIDSVMEHILGIPIHYNALVDFQAVVDTVNILGGIVVDVERAFTDQQYPDNNYGFMTVSFAAGLQTLDGERALQFVRSRHANQALEQGDFSRAKRQQKVLEALRRRALNLGLFSDANKIRKIFNTVAQNLETDIDLSEIIGLAALAQEVQREHINSLVLNDGPGGLLYTPTKEIRDQFYGGAYLLLPDGGNFNSVKELVRNFLAAPEKIEELAKLEFLNGTKVLGLADRASRPFKIKGYRVLNVGNTDQMRIYKKSHIIDRSGGQYPETLLELQRLWPEAEITARSLEPNYAAVDITVVLGADVGSGAGPANYGPLEQYQDDTKGVYRVGNGPETNVSLPPASYELAN